MAITKYGREFQTNSLLDVELWAFREGLTMAQGGLGRSVHFQNVVKEIWSDFIWYEWAYEQAEALCEHSISGFTSGASSSKSDMLAKFALVSWYADPVNTLVVVCSTTSTDAKKRVWGAIVASHRKAKAQNKAVGHLVETQAIIKLSEKTDAFAASDNSSISLVAAGNADKDNALTRLQGFKNKHVILLLDELQDCSQEITEAAIWNLNANTRWEIHAAGNAASRYDAHGLFLTPIDGWTNNNRNTHSWKIRVGGKEGIAYHFNATAPDSPNMKRFAQGLPQLPFLRKAEDSMAAMNLLGDQNATFLRQFVGYWPESEGESNYIVTDAALYKHQAYDRAEWKNTPIDIAGIDPAYSGEGDRFVLFHLKYGLSTHEVWTVEFYEAVLIRPKVTKGDDLHHANIAACKKICSDRGISPRHVAMDASAGSPLLSIAHKEWSPEILGVQFGGAASDLPVSQFDKRVASDIYANRTSELAYVFVEFLNAGQVKGIKPDHAKELTARQFEIVAGNKIKIEKKKDMKARVGYSPDLADGGHIGLNIIRERLRVQAGAGSPQAGSAGRDWKALARSRDVAAISHAQRSGKPSDLTTKVLDSAAMQTRSMERLRDMLAKRVF